MNDKAGGSSDHALAFLGVLLLVVLELVALVTAPARVHAWIGGALIGAGTSACVVAASLLGGRRSSSSRPAALAPVAAPSLAVADVEGWLGSGSLEGFPMEAVRPRLLASGAPDLNRLYTAWAFVTQGRDAVWVEQRLELPADLAHLLVQAARERH